VTSETVAYYLGIRVGEKYEPVLLRKNFQRLWDSGLFEDLRLEREDDPKGGNLVVAHVVERPKVSDLEFRGNKKLTQSQLKDKLKEGKVEIKVGGPISLRDVAKAKSASSRPTRQRGTAPRCSTPRSRSRSRTSAASCSTSTRATRSRSTRSSSRATTSSRRGASGAR
jgi:outer membrane protein assembly factor BamA